MSDITAVPLRPIRKGVLTTLWVGVALAVLVAIVWAWSGTRSLVAAAQPASEFLAANAAKSGVVTTPSGLQYEVLKKGQGPNAGPADLVLIDYEGRLTDGTVFDSSKRTGQPAVMPVGGVVPGFSEALQLMNQGSSYRIWLPPQLAYGERGGGPIPPNSVLEFDVQLHAIQPGGAAAAAQGGAIPQM